MSEALVEYDTVLAADDGSRWLARTCGRSGEGTMWEGWIEFVPLEGEARPIRSRRESTQPSRESLVYWATGLTPVYLKGALDRALDAPVRQRLPRRIEPLFDGPAPEPEPEVARSTLPPAVPHSILDPFHVYTQGEDVLIGGLDALDMPRLRDVVLAHDIPGVPEVQTATRTELTTAIVIAARAAATKV